MMRYVLFCPEGLLEDMAGTTTLPGDPPVYLVARPALRARLGRAGRPVVVGDLATPEAYARASKGHRGPIVVASPRTRLARAVAAAREALPEVPLLAVTDDARTVAGATSVALSSLGELLIRPALERAITRARVARVRERFEDAERVLILMQDDPDPDAIASALRSRPCWAARGPRRPSCTFGTITRPENLAMCKILEIEVEEIDAQALDQFDRVAMVDAQPSFLEEPIGEVDLVIDHHPVERPIKAHMKDVRPNYGATSTILAEYLRAADVKISQRLATALLYGIKSDTLGPGARRHQGGPRRVRVSLPARQPQCAATHRASRALRGRARRARAGPRAAAHPPRRVLLPPGAVWRRPTRAPVRRLRPAGGGRRVVGGVGSVGAELHISIRNVGYVRSAGEVAREAFGDLGSAGGHRTMAKAVIPFERLADARERTPGAPCRSG